MRRIVLLCVLLACACGTTANPFVKVDLRRAANAFKAAHNQFKTFLAQVQKLSVRLQDSDISDTCNDALEQLITDVQSACGSFPYNGTQEQLAAFCTDPCLDRMRNSAAQAVQACDNDNDRWVLADDEAGYLLRDIETTTEFLCMKDGDKYCYSEFQAVLNAVDAMLTKEDLDAICTPCFHKVLVASVKFASLSKGGKELWMEQFVCSKLSGEYCYPKVGDVFEAFMDAEELDASLLKSFCEPCVRSYMELVADFESIDLPYSLEAIGMMCLRNEGGQMCVDVQSQLESFGQHLMENCMVEADECPSACKGTLNSVADAAGCCAAAFAESMMIGDLVEWCGVSMPAICSPSKRVTGTLVLQNLRWEWVQANLDDFKAGLIRDLALYFGVSRADVNITDFKQRTASAQISVALQAAANGVQMTFEVAPVDGALVEQIRAKALAIDTEGFVPALSMVPLEARVDILQPIVLSAFDVAVEGAAAGIKAGIAVAAAVVVAAIANFF